MNQTEYLLTQLGEECNEIAKEISKSLRFGLSDIKPGQLLTNLERITSEINDMSAVMQMCCELEILNAPYDEDAIAAKKLKVLRYMEYARERGTLT